jgi:hypothetical protein
MADPDPTNDNKNVPQQQLSDDDGSIAIKALQDLVVALNGLVQTVTQAPH